MALSDGGGCTRDEGVESGDNCHDGSMGTAAVTWLMALVKLSQLWI
jgi:hypothetical protein